MKHALILFSILVACQIIGIGQLRDKAEQALVKGIDKQDEASILAAGSSGKRAYVPYLKAALEEPHSENALILALAKLGQQEQQQQLVCALYGPAADQMYEIASEKLPYVGGWFAIRSYTLLFSQDERFDHLRKGDEGFPGPPSLWALRELPKIVPNPSMDPPTYGEENVPGINQDTAIWKAWIASHKNELTHFRPTGAGVDFSGKSCNSDGSVKKQ